MDEVVLDPTRVRRRTGAVVKGSLAIVPIQRRQSRVSGRSKVQVTLYPSPTRGREVSGTSDDWGFGRTRSLCGPFKFYVFVYLKVRVCGRDDLFLEDPSMDL